MKRLPAVLIPALILATCLLVPSTLAQERALPMQDLDPDLSISLSRTPGVMGWTFGSAGWPNGLSPDGRDPNTVELLWDGLPVDDLISARPRYDAVPVAFLDSRSWDARGRASTTTDSLLTSSPLTRVRYESAGDGLQAVRALHVQNRTFRQEDSTGVRSSRLQTVFGYSGAGARGEYDGSRLRRAREIAFRLGWHTGTWSVWLDEVAMRRSVGAHGGVIPFSGADYASIYQRLGALVDNQDARRRTIRNDLRLGGRLHALGWDHQLVTFRTSQTLDFRDGASSTRAWTTRWGFDIRGFRPFGRGRIGWKGFAQRDAGFGGSAWTSDPESRSLTGVSALWSRDGDPVLAWSVEGGWKRSDDHSWEHVAADINRIFGRFGLRGSASHDARRSTLLDTAGFGTLVGPLGERPLQREQRLKAGVSVELGPWNVSVDGSLLREQDAITYVLDGSSILLASDVMEGWRSRTLLTATADWRNDGRKGLYGQVSGTLQTARTDGGSTLDTAWRGSMPGEWASARIGVRALLFQKDLDLDLYVRGRYWGDAGGLRLHTPTGLLVLPGAGEQPVDANWLVDVVAEGGVRGATLFLAYENVFSGTTWQVGNLIVPDYPLPRQRMRFGVYWPIRN